MYTHMLTSQAHTRAPKLAILLSRAHRTKKYEYNVESRSATPFLRVLRADENVPDLWAWRGAEICDISIHAALVHAYVRACDPATAAAQCSCVTWLVSVISPKCEPVRRL